MATSQARRERHALVDALVTRGSVRSRALEAAFRAVPREAFLPAGVGREVAAAYRDEPIVTKVDERGMPSSSSSQPSLMAVMLEALIVEPASACWRSARAPATRPRSLGRLVGRRGRVVTIDIDAATAREARAVLAGVAANVEVHAADGHDGWPAAAPYDAVIVTASTDRVPAAWHRQLRSGGRLGVPVRFAPAEAGDQAVVVFVAGADGFRSVDVISGGFMAMRTGGTDGPTGAAPTGPPRVVTGVQVADHTTEPARLLLLTGHGMDRLHRQRGPSSSERSSPDPG